MIQTVQISPPAQSAFQALADDVRGVATTFGGRFATVAKRDEALRQLTRIEAQARAVRVLLRADISTERKSA